MSIAFFMGMADCVRSPTTNDLIVGFKDNLVEQIMGTVFFGQGTSCEGFGIRRKIFCILNEPCVARDKMALFILKEESGTIRNSAECIFCSIGSRNSHDSI